MAVLAQVDPLRLGRHTLHRHRALQRRRPFQDCKSPPHGPAGGPGPQVAAGAVDGSMPLNASQLMQALSQQQLLHLKALQNVATQHGSTTSANSAASYTQTTSSSHAMDLSSMNGTLKSPLSLLSPPSIL